MNWESDVSALSDDELHADGLLSMNDKIETVVIEKYIISNINL